MSKFMVLGLMDTCYRMEWERGRDLMYGREQMG